MRRRFFAFLSTFLLSVYVFFSLNFIQDLNAQVTDNGSSVNTYIPLTTFHYENAPFSITDPVNVLTGENSLRAYFNVENRGSTNLTKLNVWLMVYIQDRANPVLFEKTFATTIKPGTKKNFIWEETLLEQGVPVDGAIVPQKVEFTDNTVWNLSENYIANGYSNGNGNGNNYGNGHDNYGANNIPTNGHTVSTVDPSYSGKMLQAAHSSGKIKLDGILDEDAWKRATPATGFLQSEPREGIEPTENTDVYVLYDEKNLYIGAMLYDSDQDGILGFQKQRDEGLWSDDRFMWIIDTFLDGRTGYYFETNPAGLLGDGLIGSGGGGGGGGTNKSWDGIWDVRTSKNDKGWIAEAKIPFQTLNFDPNKDVRGINFQRTIRRKNEEMRWSGHKRNQPLTRPIHAGRLNGLTGISQGIGLEIKPYGTFGTNYVPNIIEDDVLIPNPEDPTDVPSDIGFDISYNITPSLRGAVSINTDFAEVEVDQRRVNLTRFPLFFQEKRDFFLEGSSVFSFASRNGVNPYFSRRIGLTEGEQIPVVFGARLGGTIGRNEIGLIQVRTDDNLHAESPAEDFTIARIKRSLFEQSTIGLIYTRRASGSINSEPESDDRYTVGADLNLSTSKFLGDKNLQFEGFLVWHTDPESGGNATFNELSARGLRISYPNDLWSGHVSYRELGEEYDPAVGFVGRNGFRRVEPRLGFNPRPDFLPGVRQLQFTGQWRYLWGMNSELITSNIQYTLFEARFNTGDNFEIQLNQNFEFLDEDFEISDGIIIPIGEYNYNEWKVSSWSAGHRPVQAMVNVSWGEFWSGDRFQYRGSLNFKPFPGLSLQTEVEINDVSLPQGDFKTNVYQIQTGLHPTPRTSLTSNIQYDDVSEIIGLFAKLRWTVRPGNDLFMVYTQNWLNYGSSIWDFDTKTLSRGMSSKINYTHRF